MIRAYQGTGKRVRLKLTWPLYLALAGCGGGAGAITSEAPLAPGNPVETPEDSLPPQDSVVPPPDSLQPPPDSTVPPPDPTVPLPPDSANSEEPIPPPTHVGIPIGTYHLPSALYGAEFNGALLTAWPPTLLLHLKAAKRGSTRLFLNLSGSEPKFHGEDGHFSLEKWKRRIDRFRGIDLTPYIADGTIIGHYIMDEPHDPSNWGGKVVSRSEIDEMARYSKEIWPGMTTIIRGKPDFLKGYSYKYLDAAWAQYTTAFGDIGSFVRSNVQDSRASGLALVGGLNVINGGSKNSGIPGRQLGKHGMSASEIRTWGGALLAEPSTCAFIVWEYDSKYLSRPDIKAAFEELGQKARSLPKRSCRL